MASEHDPAAGVYSTPDLNDLFQRRHGAPVDWALELSELMCLAVAGTLESV